MHLEALEGRSRELFPSLKHFGDFYLAGGTALALQLGHRISVDLDLFSSKKIPARFVSLIKEVWPQRILQILVNNSDELTVLVDGTKVTFLLYPFPVVRDFQNFEGIHLLDVPEIAATKAYTIGRRGSYRDYVDLYFILSEHHASLPEIIALAEKKYGSEFNARLFLEQLLYVEDVGDTNIKFLKPAVAEEKILKHFEAEIKRLRL